MFEKKLQITKNQHIFPRCALKNFLNERNKVQVVTDDRWLVSEISIDTDPLTTNRSWDQRSESGNTVSEIERNFGKICAELTRKELRELKQEENHWISKMFCLWDARNTIVLSKIPDYYMGEPAREVDNDTLDQMEHYGILAPRANGMIPGRLMAGPAMLLAMDRKSEQLEGVKWGVLKSVEGDFCMPNFFAEHHIMVISPKVCLIGDHVSGFVKNESVERVNKVSVSTASRYLMARDFKMCPGL